eukprot:Hpha_TRINITY_DN16187_c4_g4::TRINITY_DN16187_c4_g4_i1::g.6602::m.6602
MSGGYYSGQQGGYHSHGRGHPSPYYYQGQHPPPGPGRGQPLPYQQQQQPPSAFQQPPSQRQPQYPPMPGGSPLASQPKGMRGVKTPQPGARPPGGAPKALPGRHAMQGGGSVGGSRGGLPQPPQSREDEELMRAMEASMAQTREQEDEEKELQKAIEASQKQMRVDQERMLAMEEKAHYQEAIELSVAEAMSVARSEAERDDLWELWQKELAESGEAKLRRAQRETYEQRARQMEQDHAHGRMERARAREAKFDAEQQQRDDRVADDEARLQELQRKERDAAREAAEAEQRALEQMDAEARAKAEEAKRLAREAREKRRREMEEDIRKAEADHTALQERIAAAESQLKVYQGELVGVQADAQRLREEAEKARTETNVVGDKTRKVHNDIEDLKGSIRVYVRTRPFNSREQQLGAVSCLEFPDDPDKRSITLKDTSGQGRAKTIDLVFDRAFHGYSSQEEVFEDCLTLCTSAADGFNVCAFAYGQTGSGKTWTLAGSDENPGVARRAMSHVFAVAEDVAKKGLELRVSASMVELYIDTFFDLLDSGKKKLNLQRSQGDKPAQLLDLTIMKAKDSKQLMSIFHRGEGNREVRSTGMNVASSRSHMIFAIRMDTYKPGTDELVRAGKLAIVDLAGSERIGKSGVTGQGMKEAIAINKALTSLGNVIQALSEKQKHIPFRDHELTQAMQEFLGGSSKTLMFVNVSPSLDNFGESKCSLMFAQRSKKVTTHDKAILEANKDKITAKQQEMTHLKRLLGELQEKSRSCDFDARKKDAECRDLMQNIGDSEKEKQKLGVEVTEAVRRVKMLKDGLVTLDQGKEEPIIRLTTRPHHAAPAPAPAPASDVWVEPGPDERKQDYDGFDYLWEDFQAEYGDGAREAWTRAKPPGGQLAE